MVVVGGLGKKINKEGQEVEEDNPRLYIERFGIID
jgi:hypothetical protein